MSTNTILSTIAIVIWWFLLLTHLSDIPVIWGWIEDLNQTQSAVDGYQLSLKEYVFTSEYQCLDDIEDVQKQVSSSSSQCLDVTVEKSFFSYSKNACLYSIAYEPIDCTTQASLWNKTFMFIYDYIHDRNIFDTACETSDRASCDKLIKAQQEVLQADNVVVDPLLNTDLESSEEIEK